MPLYVSESNPRALDDAFVDAYPALGLKTTANSGAFWGDGDLRAEALDYDRVFFAVESKARFRGPQSSKLTPTPAEWDKAMGTDTTPGQLKKFAPGAVRLFLIYARPLRAFSVSIPLRDRDELAGHSSALKEALDRGAVKTLRRGAIEYAYYTESQWDAVYDALLQHQPL
jgi:hypothetical protein